jgi:hypothetical protein
MNQLIFIIIIVVILILLKIYHLNEKFELSNQTQTPNDGIYNHFYQQVLNPYEYPMTPFFSNDSQQLPKPSPDYPKY